jgi:hypothetical protein
MPKVSADPEQVFKARKVRKVGKFLGPRFACYLPLLGETVFRSSCKKSFRIENKKNLERQKVKVERDQGCQMVYFQTENSNLGKFYRGLQGKR